MIANNFNKAIIPWRCLSWSEKVTGSEQQDELLEETLESEFSRAVHGKKSFYMAFRKREEALFKFLDILDIIKTTTALVFSSIGLYYNPTVFHVLQCKKAKEANTVT